MATPTKDPGAIRFTAKIQSVGEKFPQNGWVEFPYDLKETYGVGNLVPIIVTYDGFEYRGSLAKMGGPPMLLLRKDIFEKLGKKVGDEIKVVVNLDKASRIVKVPKDFAKILQESPQAKEIFDAMSYSHRREYIEWITSAKLEETRKRRMGQAVEQIRSKKPARK
jgi:hypothetical protein